MSGSDFDFDFDQVDFVTSDHHFGHARIGELAGRPFSSVAEMDRAMVERWNALVRPDDVVLHLGDLALGPIEQSIALTSQLNGRRLLVPGNHDRVSPATQSTRAIERFRPLYEEAGWTVLPEIVRGTRRGAGLLASHYPYAGDTTGVERHSSHRPVDEGIPLLHGHIHSREFGPCGSHEFHVGVDAFDFAPIQFEVIDAWMQDLRSEEHEIATILRERVAGGESESLDELAARFEGVTPPGAMSRGQEGTAMNIVQRAQRGEISRADLLDALLGWDFEPRYRARGVADDWEFRANSFDAVYHAYMTDLIDEQAYERIRERLDERAP